MEAFAALLVWALLPDGALAHAFSATASELWETRRPTPSSGKRRGGSVGDCTRLPPWVHARSRSAAVAVEFVAGAMLLPWRVFIDVSAWSVWLLLNPPPALALGAACAWGCESLVGLLVPEGAWERAEQSAAAEEPEEPEEPEEAEEAPAATLLARPQGKAASAPTAPVLAMPGPPARQDARSAGGVRAHDSPSLTAGSAPERVDAAPAPSTPPAATPPAAAARAERAPTTTPSGQGALAPARPAAADTAPCSAPAAGGDLLSAWPTERGLLELSAALPNVVAEAATSFSRAKLLQMVEEDGEPLGSGTFGQVSQLLLPWPAHLLPQVQAAFPAAAAGLPVVAKVIRGDGDGLCDRTFEAAACTLANGCRGFARLLHDVHGEEASVLLFACVTPAPQTLWDYVEGRRDRGEGPIPHAQAVSLAGQVVAALADLHTLPMPLVHTDIKPNNMVVFGGGSGVYVVDLGAAVASGTTLGEAGLRGTPNFVAPEVQLSDDLPPRAPERWSARYEPSSDYFALGAVVLFMMAQGATARWHAVVRAAYKRATPAGELCPTVGRYWERSMRTAMCRLPGATEGLVRLVLALMAPGRLRPREHSQVEALLREAAANGQPAEMPPPLVAVGPFASP